MSLLTSPLLIPIMNIIEDISSTWSEERKTRFLKDHHEILTEIKNAKNKIYPNYTDAALDLANQRLCIFVEAFGSQLRKANLEILQQRKGQA